MKKSDLPNLLSLIRLALVPVFIFLFLHEDPDLTIPALIIFIAAGITDIVDGHIARKYHCTSELGKVLDPLADKAMQASAFVCLFVKELIPLWVVIVFCAKELLMLIGALFIFRKTKFVVKSNVIGKSATVLVFIAVFVFALFGERIGPYWTNIICGVVIGYIIFALCCYLVSELRAHRDLLRRKQELQEKAEDGEDLPEPAAKPYQQQK